MGIVVKLHVMIYIIPVVMSFTIPELDENMAPVTISSMASSGEEEHYISTTAHKHAGIGRKLTTTPFNPGFISIDCGLPEGSSSYVNPTTSIVYASDAGFVEGGESRSVSPEFNPLLRPSNHFGTLRSFPEGKRNCYTLRPEQGKNNKYLIRASFLYGNYDDQNRPPKFDLHLGPNLWATISFAFTPTFIMQEIIHVSTTDSIDICLVNTDTGVPFISALELRLLDNSIYKTQSGSLATLMRWNCGSNTKDYAIRFKDDVYDRIWNPFNSADFDAIETEWTTNISPNYFNLPATVMRTAMMQKPLTDNKSISFIIPNYQTVSSEYYVYMHFAEIDNPNGSLREFSIDLNGRRWIQPFTPPPFAALTQYTTGPITGANNFTLHATSESVLPPLINAMELYAVIRFPMSPTQQDDVDAIINIKRIYAIKRNWQGDPCLPQEHLWDGLNCSISNGNINGEGPQITALNLTASNLSGMIDPAFSNLTSLQELDLSCNDLTGSIPEFLAQMPSLRTIILTGNSLTQSVPRALREKVKNGSLALRMNENPDICALISSNDIRKKGRKTWLIVIISVVATFLVLFIFVVSYWKYKEKAKQANKEGLVKSIKRKFSYSEIASITNNFQTKIGTGGSGHVYHGRLDDGTQVAVKIISPSSQIPQEQFMTEVEVLMTIHNKNLASLLGYCDEPANMALIYEYMSNGNLQQHLSEESENILSWEQRIQIAVHAAQGLEYLHHGCNTPIIHRDMKTANILLNDKFQAKIADFGFSKILPSESASYVDTKVVGTFGYFDPEYITTKRLNIKSDIYSFGIVLLELITGQPRIYENVGIIDRVKSMLTQGDIEKIVDPRLQRNFNIDSAKKVLQTAMACVPPTAVQRPCIKEVLSDLRQCLALVIT